MLVFVSSLLGALVVALAIRSGQKNGYPYLGEIEVEDENE